MKLISSPIIGAGLLLLVVSLHAMGGEPPKIPREIPAGYELVKEFAPSPSAKVTVREGRVPARVILRRDARIWERVEEFRDGSISVTCLFHPYLISKRAVGLLITDVRSMEEGDGSHAFQPFEELSWLRPDVEWQKLEEGDWKAEQPPYSVIVDGKTSYPKVSSGPSGEYRYKAGPIKVLPLQLPEEFTKRLKAYEEKQNRPSVFLRKES